MSESTNEDMICQQSPEVTSDDLRPPSVPRGRSMRSTIVTQQFDGYAEVLCPGTGSTEILIPRWVYIRDRTGRYLTLRAGPQYATITFRAGTPDLACAFEAVRTGYQYYWFLDNNKRNIMRYHIDSGWYSSDGVSTPSFNIIHLREDIVYLKDNYTPPRFFSNELRHNGAPMAKSYITEASEMQIVQAAVKNEIFNVRYDLPGAQIYNVAPLIALRTTVRNDSDNDVSQTLTYSYEKWAVGTWNDTAGVEIGAKMTFKAGVPFISSAEFELSVTASYTRQWGGETGVRQIVSSSTTVNVPKRMQGRATVLVRNAQIDVGFTYTQRTLWASGMQEDQQKRGVYNNVDSWDVGVVVDNLGSV